MKGGYLLAGLVLSLQMAVAGSSIELNLLVFERHPYVYQQQGELQGLLGETVRKALIAADVNYRVIDMPASRILNRIQQSTSADCALGWFKTFERERFARFSNPLSRSEPLQLLIRTGHPLLSQPIKVEQLLSNSSLSMLAKQSYSYGQAFDILFDQFNPPRKLVTIDNDQLFQMLKAGRGDYSLIAPEEFQAIQLRQPDLIDGLQLVPLVNAPAGELRYLMCSQQLEPQVLNRINRYLPPVD